MSRNYYIRTFTNYFDFDMGDGGVYGYTTNNVLETYNESANGSTLAPYGIRTKPNSVFSTTTQDLFYMSYDSDRYGTPYYEDMDASNIFKVTTSDGYLYWYNYGIRNGGYKGYSDLGWSDQYHKWSSPTNDSATWHSELCHRFDTYRAGSEESYGNNWNLYIFKYQFTDTPTDGNTNLAFAYFPIFMRGNDPNYDSKIII